MTSKGYNIKEYIASFQLQILLELVESISKLENLNDKTLSQIQCIEKKLTFIKYKCPILPTTTIIRSNLSTNNNNNTTNGVAAGVDNTADHHSHQQHQSKGFKQVVHKESEDLITDFDDYNKKHSLLLLSEEGQESALALGYFLNLTKCKSSQQVEQILPLLIGIVNHLPHCKWNQKAKITGEYFSYHLISLLRDISYSSNEYSNQITNSLINICLNECYLIMKSYESKFIFDSDNTARVLYGVFKALSEGLPNGMSHEQYKIVNEIVQYFINITTFKQSNEIKQLKAFKSRLLKSMIVLVLKILINIVSCTKLESDEISKLILISFRNLTLENYKRIITSKHEDSIDTNYSINAFCTSCELLTNCSLLKIDQLREVLKIFIECLDFSKSYDGGFNKFEEKMIKEIINCIEKICKSEHYEYITLSIKTLREFIEESNDKSENLIELITKCISNILINDFNKRGSLNTSSAVFAISNNIYLNPDDSIKNNRRVTLLGNIATEIDHNPITDSILPVLSGQLTKKRSMGKLDNLSLRALSHLIDLGNGHYFNEIVELIFSIYQNPFHSSETVIGGLLIDSIYIMNKKLKNRLDLKYLLLMKLIKLINRLGGEIQIMKESNEKKKDMLKHIAVLMPAVATLTKSVNNSINSNNNSNNNNNNNNSNSNNNDVSVNGNENENNMKDKTFTSLFRMMWFYIIIFKFNNPNEYNDETFESCQVIGMNGPILLNSNVHTFMEINKEIEVILDSKNISQEEKSYFTQQLESYINHGKDILVNPSILRQLTIEEVLFLISMFNLELFRARSGQPLKHLLNYLEHCQIFTNIVNTTLQSLLRRIFEQWLLIYIKSQSRDEMNHILEQETIYLFKMCIHRLEIVRQISHQFIIMIIKSFPSMYWSSNNLSALLEIQSALYQGNDNGKTTSIISVKIKKNFNNQPNTIYTMSNTLNNTSNNTLNTSNNNNGNSNGNNNNGIMMNNIMIKEEEEYEEYYLPENYSDRCKLFESFNRFTLSWISKSMTVAPNVTQTALQHYLIKFQQSDVSSLRHFGYTFAVYLSTPIEHLQAVGSNVLLKSDKRGFSILSEDQVSLTQSISVMSFSSGQANSLKLMLGQRGAESLIINQLSNLMKLYNTMNSNSNNTNNNNNTNMNGNMNGNGMNMSKFYEQLSDTMKLATAFILSENVLIISLLQWIVWLPVYIFTKESMDIAIYCWNWISSVKSNDFNIPLLSEISNAWQFTIQKGYGLFSGHHEKDEAVELAVKQSQSQPNTQSQSQSNTSMNINPFNNTNNNSTSVNGNNNFNNVSEFKIYLENQNINHVKKDSYPHRIWINYLSERYQSGGLLNEAIVDIYLKMLLRSVENINRLSKLHSSLGTRFRLSNLSLQVSRSVIDLQFYDYIANATILQHRTFAALLNWFTLHPTWYNPGSNHMVQDDLKVLLDVKKRIKREQSELNRYQSININDSNNLQNSSSATIIDNDNISISGMSVRTSSRSVGFSIKAISSSQLLNSSSDGQDFDNTTTLLPPINMMNTSMGGGGSVSGLSGAHSGAAHSGGGGGGGGTSKSDTRTVVYSTSGVDAILDVLLLLISHEYDRMIIWNEPQKMMQEDYSKISLNKWKIFISTAWSFSPKLAIKMHVRFPFDIIRDELEKLVKKFPLDSIHIPESTEYLINELNCKLNISELNHLLTWSTCTLSMALRYLNKPLVTNLNVQQYAIRTLRKFSPEAVIFYLPQLVQCLRHDYNNLLKQFLISLVKNSVMFTHQLIWTLRTEIVDSHLTSEELLEIKLAEFELSDILKPFYIDVIKAFDTNQIRLYKEEFHFFDKITKISGLLVPVEKEKRQERLIQFMKDIKPSSNLYTPTNTQFSITGLDHLGSRTLKSAKKVPILIPFYVKQRPLGFDIGEDLIDSNNTNSMMNNMNSNNKNIKLPCIFKAGDDCRHDQLALQIISMFQRVFERIELPLYLFPYRVITTGRGLGIIECVPNSKSRHQIGDSINAGDNLYNYFIRKYGNTHTVEFQRARMNFIHSMAAYSIVSFILSIKDRHNGNIMLDEEGHVIHIDFGFIFDILPGGKFGIEQVVPFKLTTEMLALMGEEQAIEESRKKDPSQQLNSNNSNSSNLSNNNNRNISNNNNNSNNNKNANSTSTNLNSSKSKGVSINDGSMDSNQSSSELDSDTSEHSEPYNLFVDLMIRGYLAARDHMDSIIAISEVMVQSGLPCFAKEDSIERLKQRLCAGKSEREAILFIKQKIKASYQNVFSVIYDVYQERVEGVNR